MTTSGFAHDFSRVHISAKAPVTIQAKLAIGTSEDGYEQEADRFARQVMSPQGLRGACSCGAECPRCQAKQSGQEYKHLQTRRVQANDDEKIAAPPIVQDVLRSPGRPLDPATRRFMEPRFGYDFSRVRVHTDAKSAESARAINALAYTVGQDMVFGAGQYLPETNEGRQLVAHELTHVMQQTASVGGHVVQRQPDKPTKAEVKLAKKLEELARDPGDAHLAWKSLGLAEQIAVVEKMRRRYGEPFAEQFLDEVKKGKPQVEVRYYQPGTGPNTEQLLARGYKWAGMEHLGNAAFEVEVWVHPSGVRVRRDVSTWKFGEGEPGKKPATDAKTPPARVQPTSPDRKPPMDERCKDVQTLGNAICDNAARICKIADELGDDAAARESCQKARNSCQDSNKRVGACGS